MMDDRQYAWFMKMVDIADEKIDDMIETHGLKGTIEYLLEMGFEVAELAGMGFPPEDIDAAVLSMEEEEGE
jgi:hypothetical protein